MHKGSVNFVTSQIEVENENFSIFDCFLDYFDKRYI